MFTITTENLMTSTAGGTRGKEEWLYVLNTLAGTDQQTFLRRVVVTGTTMDTATWTFSVAELGDLVRLGTILPQDLLPYPRDEPAAKAVFAALRGTIRPSAQPGHLSE